MRLGQIVARALHRWRLAVEPALLRLMPSPGTPHALHRAILAGASRLLLGRVTVARLAWMDDSEAKEALVLEPTDTALVCAPSGIEEASTREVVSLAPVIARHFRNVMVMAEGSAVLEADAATVWIERVPGISPSKANYAKGLVRQHDEHHAIVRDAVTVDLARGCFLGGNGAWNYYHWMIEILPRLRYLERMPSQWRETPLLVHRDVLRVASLRDSLHWTAGADRDVLPLDPSLVYRVGDLAYVAHVNQLPFSIRGDGFYESTFTRLRPSSFDWMRERFLPHAHTPVGAAPRVFLRRKATRRHYNQDEVEAMLTRYGFVPYELEDFSLAEQIGLVAQAECIVGPTGAAWTNLLFASPGCRALCWMPNEFGDFSVYSTLAEIRGVKLRYVRFDTGFTPRELYFKPYQIDVARLEHGVRRLLG